MQGEAELIGAVLDGRYRVLARLARGGMGTVYVAEHLGLGQRRAIKFLREELSRQPGALKRFLQEARTLSTLRHKNVVTVIDLGEHAGTAYYVMELLEGEDLRARLRREGKLLWAQTREIALQVCKALGVVHAKGIIHRDLKPENCFCVAESEPEDFIRIIDFGVAKVPRGAGDTQLTGSGETVGTVGYMAPEQIDGRGDPRTDIYALGVMIFECISGQLPFTGGAFEVIAKLARGVTPPQLQGLIAEVDPGIEALVQKAMAREPGARFADMREFAAAIAAIPPHAAPHSRAASTGLHRPADPAGDIDPSAETVQGPGVGDASPLSAAPQALTQPPHRLPSERYTQLPTQPPHRLPSELYTQVPSQPPHRLERNTQARSGFRSRVLMVIAILAFIALGAKLLSSKKVPPLVAEDRPATPEDPRPEPTPAPSTIEIKSGLTGHTAQPSDPSLLSAVPPPGQPQQEEVSFVLPSQPPVTKPSPTKVSGTKKPWVRTELMTRTQLRAAIEQSLVLCRTFRELKFDVNARVAPSGELIYLGLVTQVPPGSVECVKDGLRKLPSTVNKKRLEPGEFSISVVLRAK